MPIHTNHTTLSADIFKNILRYQIYICLLSTLVCAILDVKLALAALIGSATAIASNLVLKYFTFRYQGAKYAKQIVSSLFIGVALKFTILIIVISITLIVWPEVNILVLLGTLIVTQILPTFLSARQK